MGISLISTNARIYFGICLRIRIIIDMCISFLTIINAPHILRPRHFQPHHLHLQPQMYPLQHLLPVYINIFFISRVSIL